MTSKTTRRRLIKASAATAAAATIPQSVAASHDESSDGAFFDGEAEIVAENSPADKALAFAMGIRERVTMGLNKRNDASTIGDDLQEHFNPRSADYRNWVNDRGKGNADHQVFELALIQGNTEDRRYLVTDYDTGSEAYTSAEMMDQSSFDSTGRSVDVQSELSGGAAASAPEEMRTFYADFVEPNEDLTGSYKTRMAAKYGESPHVTSELLGDEL